MRAATVHGTCGVRQSCRTLTPDADTCKGNAPVGTCRSRRPRTARRSQAARLPRAHVAREEAAIQRAKRRARTHDLLLPSLAFEQQQAAHEAHRPLRRTVLCGLGEREPFVPGFEFISTEAGKDPAVTVVHIGMEVEQGGGPKQKVRSQFLLKKHEQGWQLLPSEKAPSP